MIAALSYDKPFPSATIIVPPVRLRDVQLHFQPEGHCGPLRASQSDWPLTSQILPRRLNRLLWTSPRSGACLASVHTANLSTLNAALSATSRRAGYVESIAK